MNTNKYICELKNITPDMLTEENIKKIEKHLSHCQNCAGLLKCDKQPHLDDDTCEDFKQNFKYVNDNGHVYVCADEIHHNSAWPQYISVVYIPL